LLLFYTFKLLISLNKGQLETHSKNSILKNVNILSLCGAHHAHNLTRQPKFIIINWVKIANIKSVVFQQCLKKKDSKSKETERC